MDVVRKVWGQEEILTDHTSPYTGKRMTLKHNHCCSLHHHAKKDETFFVLSGRMLLEVKDRQGVSVFYDLKPGDSYRIKPGIPHRFYGIRETVFMEISSPDDPDDSYRITLSQSGIPKDMMAALDQKSREMLEQVMPLV